VDGTVCSKFAIAQDLVLGDATILLKKKYLTNEVLWHLIKYLKKNKKFCCMLLPVFFFNKQQNATLHTFFFCFSSFILFIFSCWTSQSRYE